MEGVLLAEPGAPGTGGRARELPAELLGQEAPMREALHYHYRHQLTPRLSFTGAGTWGPGRRPT